jgi:hypothetical protein
LHKTTQRIGFVAQVASEEDTKLLCGQSDSISPDQPNNDMTQQIYRHIRAFDRGKITVHVHNRSCLGLTFLHRDCRWSGFGKGATLGLVKNIAILVS